MKYLLFILLIGCSKQECDPPTITAINGNVVYYPEGSYTMEVQGLDNPYHGFLQVSGNSQRVEGEKYQVRIKSSCSNYSEWKQN